MLSTSQGIQPLFGASYLQWVHKIRPSAQLKTWYEKRPTQIHKEATARPIFRVELSPLQQPRLRLRLSVGVVTVYSSAFIHPNCRSIAAILVDPDVWVAGPWLEYHKSTRVMASSWCPLIKPRGKPGTAIYYLNLINRKGHLWSWLPLPLDLLCHPKGPQVSPPLQHVFFCPSNMSIQIRETHRRLARTNKINKNKQPACC